MSREYTTQNHVQIVCVIKCNEFSEGTLVIHLAHPFITARILFYLCSQMTGDIFGLEIQFRYFWKAETCSHLD